MGTPSFGYRLLRNQPRMETLLGNKLSFSNFPPTVEPSQMVSQHQRHQIFFTLQTRWHLQSGHRLSRIQSSLYGIRPTRSVELHHHYGSLSYYHHHHSLLPTDSKYRKRRSSNKLLSAVPSATPKRRHLARPTQKILYRSHRNGP